MHTSTQCLCETQIILLTTCIYYFPVNVFELSMKQLMVFEAMAIISGFYRANQVVHVMEIKNKTVSLMSDF